MVKLLKGDPNVERAGVPGRPMTSPSSKLNGSLMGVNPGDGLHTELALLVGVVLGVNPDFGKEAFPDLLAGISTADMMA